MIIRPHIKYNSNIISLRFFHIAKTTIRKKILDAKIRPTEDMIVFLKYDSHPLITGQSTRLAEQIAVKTTIVTP
jgi:hypothetical protein